MKRRAPRSFAGLKTRTLSCTLIGGEGKFCAERFGWAETDKGIVSSYGVQQYDPTVTISYAVFAQYLPAHGYAVISSRFGQFFKWNTTEFTPVKSAAIIASSYPFIVPCIVDGESAYAAFCGTKVGVMKKESVVQTALPNKLFRGAMHCGRVYAADDADRYVVRWSGYDITDWTESIDGGGHIRLNPAGGGVLNILEYGEKLVLVRENGLTVFNVLGDPRHLRSTTLEEHAVPAVIGDTSVICGGQLYFCTADGLFVYRGGVPERVQLDLCDEEFTFVRARAIDGRYIYFEGTVGGEMRIAEYDTKSGGCAQFAKECSMLFAMDGQLYCINNNKVQCLSKDFDDESRVWRSKEIDFNAPTAKTLKRLTVEGEGSFEVTVFCDGRVAGVYGAGVHNVCGVCGRGVGFVFEVAGKGKVNRLCAEWEVSE